jgi:hypothetical protein
MSTKLRYHYACLEQSSCCFCGASGLISMCASKDCRRIFHVFCLQRRSKKAKVKELNCGLHPEKKKKEGITYAYLFKKIANTIQLEAEKMQEYKEFRTEIKALYFSHGQIFWAIIGTQYFPSDFAGCRLPALYPKARSYSWNKGEKCWVSKTGRLLSRELKACKDSNKALFKSLFPAGDSLKVPEKCKLTEKELLIGESKSQRLKRFEKEFLSFFERNYKLPQLEADTSVCEICKDDDYDDDDLILPCSVCKVTVHMLCYGILSELVPFTCMACKASSIYKDMCALCPVTGGVLKPTVNNATVAFPTHNGLPLNTKIWVHVFCAQHIEQNCIRDKVTQSNIDLQQIDKKKFTETCAICNSTNGACIKCTSVRCKRFFHAECAKGLFLYTRNRNAPEEVCLYCKEHKMSRLRRSVEVKEKKVYKDFTDFIRFYEKLDLELGRKKNDERRAESQ